MKRVQITISPPGRNLPPLYRELTIDSESLSRVEIVNWNVANPPAAFLLRLEGEYESVTAGLTDRDDVQDTAVVAIDETTAYCFLAGDGVTVARRLFEHFTQAELLTVPPIRCHTDGSSSFGLIGTGESITRAVEEMPPDVETTIETVGTGPVDRTDLRTVLTPRQREAVRAAIRLRYYETPRHASIDDVAAVLNCSPATASEHLRKAECKLVTTVFGPRRDLTGIE